MKENNQAEEKQIEIPSHFDWQGHRGCRGLLPENSIEGFLHALNYPIQTLELDVVLTKDLVVLVSHEPWFSPDICSGHGIDSNNIYHMTYTEVQKVVCGHVAHPKFPEQKLLETHKPSLISVIQAVRDYCEKNNREMPRFNIELKSEQGWERIYLPDTRTFVERVYQVIRTTQIEDLCTIQSFNVDVLNTFMSLHTSLKFAFLTEERGAPIKVMKDLKKLPHIYSPYHKNVNSEVVAAIRQMKMKIIPWTVNTEKEMRSLIEVGVDGIITDYPNLIKQIKN